MPENNTNKIIEKDMSVVLHESMIPYAENVIMDRALPRVEDGLKPVQRRILFTMYELGLDPDKAYKKCARIVGDCLGKYHPHGDSSVYDALVRLAQPFNCRMPLVDGHGNFGSVDGFGAAAMRYTEARLTPLSLTMLNELNKNTVKFNLNFDDTLKEPDILPCRFPNLLVNGASGIAVGLATNIPTHNLGEVINGAIALLENPKITVNELMQYIPGPDFPSGGYIVGTEGIKSAYETGKGKLILRAKIHVEDGEYEKKNIVISELPYQVAPPNVMTKIKDLRDQKKGVLMDISEIADESDMEGMRIVIRVRKGGNADEILKVLYKNTDLETSFSCNIVAIAEGKPQVLGLKKILTYYNDYQRQIIVRRSEFDLNVAKDREHIVEGLLVAVRNIDEVVKTIKSSPNTTQAKINLKNKFDLSDKQAQAILDMRLARLTNLEVVNLQEEQKKLLATIAELEGILKSKAKQTELMKKEMLQIKKSFADPRKTKIVNGSEEAAPIEINDDVDTSFECTLLYTKYGIKRLNKININVKSIQDEMGIEDSVVSNVISTVSNARMIAFTSFGNAYRFNPNDVPEKRMVDRMVPYEKVIKMENKEKVIKIMLEEEMNKSKALYFMTKEGMIKKSEISEYDIKKQVYQAIKLKDSDEVINVECESDKPNCLFITKQGLSLKCELTDVPYQGRVSGGVKGINLNSNDEVVFAELVDDDGELIVVTSNCGLKRVIVADLEESVRYRKGVKITDLQKNSVVSYTSIVKEPYHICILAVSGRSYVIYSEDIEILDRARPAKVSKEYKDVEVYDVLKHIN